MENYNNEIFSFGDNSNNEQVTNFNYDSLNGLGQSDYENEDLFSTEVEDNSKLVFDNYYKENTNDSLVENGDVEGVLEDNKNSFDHNFENQEFYSLKEDLNNSDKNQELNTESFEEIFNETPVIDNLVEMPKINFNPMTGESLNIEGNLEPVFETSIEPEVYSTPEVEQPVFESFVQEEQPEQIPVFETSTESEVYSTPEVEQPVFESFVQEDQPTQVPVFETSTESEVYSTPEVEQPVFESFVQEEQPEQIIEPNFENTVETEDVKIEISDTPIEELTKLTEYKKEKIEETDINSLFDRVNVNVKDASDIFRKNTNIKQKIDTRFEELKKLQSELENSRKKQMDEINKYKEEVLDKLTEKKEEIERRLNVLKELQVNLEKDKKDFEDYKKKEQDNIDRVQKEVQSAYDDRREELNHIEDVLRKQKDALDEERSQLSLDRIQYESDKNELANNLLKFNEIVNAFTDGVNGTKE